MILEKFALTDKVAIVTGSGRGLGKSIALGFAEAGAHVVVAGINILESSQTLPEIEGTAEDIRALGRRSLALPVDMRNGSHVASMVERTLEEFGRIDILVNNVGGTFRVSFLDVSEGAWDAIIRENLKTTFLGCKAVSRTMIEQKKGCIINIVSIEGLRAFIRGGVAYGASKAGIINLTQTLASEWGPYHIRVNAIAPGVIETPGSSHWRTPEHLNELLKIVPLGCLGQPEDIATAAIYLASEASNFVTGQTIVVDGGVTTSQLL